MQIPVHLLGVMDPLVRNFVILPALARKCVMSMKSMSLSKASTYERYIISKEKVGLNYQDVDSLIV